MQCVLIIDDNDAVCTALSLLLSLHDIESVSAATPAEGLAFVETGNVDLVIQDMNFTADTTSGDEGIALFHAIRERAPDLPVVLLTAWTNLETAVDLVKAGAGDYLAKPWDDAKLITTVRNLLELKEMTERNQSHVGRLRAARARLGERFDLRGTVYRSEAMHEVVAMATKVAAADVPVLITGANGAGKEKLAEIVQANSGCRDGPFVKVNVGALPADLIESELFGAKAGAYTGATSAREGRFSAADGGTLFLDEIGNLGIDGQAKLLRVLQTGEFEPLGSTRTERVDVRVISATNTDLRQAVHEGRFREDLYYRLNVIELQAPALAERRDDILPLAQHFLGDDKVLDDSAERALLAHGWPGNVRELVNCIKRASLLAGGDTLSAGDLKLSPAAAPPPGSRADEPDRASVEAALARHRGVVARAARELGLSRQALYRRMEKYGLAK
ncbi:MAG: sigma-54 dependent transcriptional regulator [Pseudomonadota bacterium]